jgi:hypothetical protein
MKTTSLQHQRILRLAIPLAIAFLLFLRAPYALLKPQFWAEDATVFFDQAARLGIASLTQPQVGYLHEFPRIVAWTASFLPSGPAPLIYAWSAYLAGLAAVLLIARSSVGGHRSFGPVAALVIAFIPHLSQEIFWSLINVQWTVSAFLVVLLVADPPETKTGTWMRTAFSFLAGTTSPLSAILLPVLMLRLWLLRTTRQVWPLAAAVFSGILQATVIAANGQGMLPANHPSLAAYLEIIGRRIFIEGFLPANFWPAASAHSMLTGALGTGLLFAGIILVRRLRPACLLLLAAASLVCYASMARMSASIPKMFDLDLGGFGDRYFFPIRITIILILLIMAYDESRILRLGATAILCMIPFAAMSSFTAPAQPDLNWSRYAPLIDAQIPVDIPINPVWFGVYHYRPPGT